MRAVVAISGCGPRLEVALGGNLVRAINFVGLAGPTPRSDILLAAVDLLLRSAGVTPGDLDAVVATRGPGSFTGIRVTLAAAQGIAMGAGIPAQGFCSLLAQAARTDLEEVLAVQPARRGEVYAQAFQRRQGRWQATNEPSTLPVVSLANSSLPVVAPAGLELPAQVPRAPAARSTAEALLELAAAFPVFDAATLAPVYVDPPAAVVPTRES